MARLDERLITLNDELRRSQRRHDAATTEVNAASRDLTTLTADAKALDEADKRDEAELTRYRHQVTQALRSLESGLGDYTSAERQLAASKAEIDRLETAVLERMEARDALDARIAEARARLKKGEEALALVKATDEPKVAAWKAELDQVLADRAALGAQLPAGDRSIWAAMLKRRDTATAWLSKDRACSSCHLDVPKELGPRIEKGQLHVCTSCGRWLLSPLMEEQLGIVR
jgi:predicted  nucleic acid-binding Zn-ribbon protein